MARRSKKVAVIGLWHLGSVYAASLAKMGFSVTGIDLDSSIVDNLRAGKAPLFEPDLEETMKKYTKNLRFSNDFHDLQGTDYIFITHDVEVDEQDRANLTTLKKLFRAVVQHMDDDTSVVISSQIPVGTSRLLVKELQKRGIKEPKVIYFPENLRLGTAFDSFFKPDRIIVGSDSTSALDEFEQDLKFNTEVIRMGLESAEMVKHALNSYLATCISWSSEMSDLSEKVGANMSDVVRALKTEKRVSPYAPISPGIGFAGGTLGRDVQALRALGRQFAYSPQLFNAVYSVNRDRLPMLIAKMESVYPNLKNKKIGILGLTYKPNTSTLRRSMSLELAKLLMAKGSIIKAFDPMIKEEVPEMPYIQVCKKLNDFFKDLDLVLLMNECSEFKNVTPKQATQGMKHRVLLDAKNFFEQTQWEKHGFTYIGMGVPVESLKAN